LLTPLAVILQLSPLAVFIKVTATVLELAAAEKIAPVAFPGGGVIVTLNTVTPLTEHTACPWVTTPATGVIGVTVQTTAVGAVPAVARMLVLTTIVPAP
jgi:hypothetical protein